MQQKLAVARSIRFIVDDARAGQHLSMVLTA
jgi:hypothetical protein